MENLPYGAGKEKVLNLQILFLLDVFLSIEHTTRKKSNRGEAYRAIFGPAALNVCAPSRSLIERLTKQSSLMRWAPPPMVFGECSRERGKGSHASYYYNPQKSLHYRETVLLAPSNTEHKKVFISGKSADFFIQERRNSFTTTLEGDLWQDMSPVTGEWLEKIFVGTSFPTFYVDFVCLFVCLRSSLLSPCYIYAWDWTGNLIPPKSFYLKASSSWPWERRNECWIKNLKLKDTLVP